MNLIFSNYDAPQNPYYGGGGARAIHEVARRLARRHQVKVVTGKFPGSQNGVIEGVAYSRLGAAHAGPKLGQLLFQFLLPWTVRRKQFDLWVESLTPPFSTACLQLFTRQPVIALTQVMAGRAMTRKYKLPFATFERLGLKTYRHAIALSEYLQAEITRANPAIHVTVIPNGTDHALIQQTVVNEPAHFLFLGRLDLEQKGLDLLLEAYHGIAAATSVPLLIAGSGAAPDEALLVRRIKELGLEGKVRLLGRVAGEQKHDLLRQAVCLAMPSRFEASPLVMIEAFCHKLPVVLFGIPELAEMPADCCLKVAPFDTHALGQALLELSLNATRQRAMGRAAKAFARRFDWDDLAKKYEDFFETVLKKR